MRSVPVRLGGLGRDPPERVTWLGVAVTIGALPFLQPARLRFLRWHGVLKRTSDGGHMGLQAIRYAAMVSAITFERAVQIHSTFL